MIDFLQRLRQRKLVQWGLAYLAAAFAIVQAVDLVAGHFDWSPSVVRYLILAFAVGFCVILVLAWYHGDHGAQRASGTELLIVALLLAIGGVVVGYLGPRVIARNPAVAGRGAATGVPATAAAPILAKSIAVLPFENLSSDKENAYFVSGMQDLILTKLADIGDLKVISRTSTLKYKSRPENLKTVAGELGVATIVEGSVQKHGKQVMINVQLIDTRTDTHLWAQTYTRTLDNIFGVEGEVAGKIAGALHAKLSPAQSAQLATVPTTNQAAYDLFLRADYLANRSKLQGDPAGFKVAIPLYQQAIAQDPKFALAYARLSWAQTILAFFGGGGEDIQQLQRQALADAGRALKLDAKDPAAHVALGYTHLLGDNDFAAALQAFKVALALRPNDVDALTSIGLAQRRLGDFDTAITSFTRAVGLDPRNGFTAFHLGLAYMAVGRYDDTMVWYQRSLALQPGSRMARNNYASAILFSSGDIPGALDQVQGDAPPLKLARVTLLAYQRKFSAAAALLEGVPDTPDNFPPGSPKVLQLALIHWQAGDTRQARLLFAKALALDWASLPAHMQGSDTAIVWRSKAWADLGTGHTPAGLAEIMQAEASLPAFNDALFVPALRLDFARAYVMAERADLAVAALTKVLAVPGGGASYSPVMLWIDPWWDPIRKDARFQALLVQYAKYKPAVIPPASAASL